MLSVYSMSAPNEPPLWEQWWPHFEKTMKKRLQAGHEEYGDDSFNLSPVQLMGEIREELLDIVGWGFLLWVRLTQLQEDSYSPVAGEEASDEGDS